MKMLPKTDGPSDVKRKRFPDIKADILDMAEGHDPMSQDTVTLTVEETTETTTSNDSVISLPNSYGSCNLDLGYFSCSGDSASTCNAFDEPDLNQGEEELAQTVPVNEFSDSDTLDPGYESLLCQFDTFFRTKLDEDLSTFQNNMHSLLTEQQVHVRRLISSASPLSSDWPTEVDNGGSFHTATDGPITNLLKAKKSVTEERCSYEEAETQAKTGLVIELLTLSCQITELLNQRKFKS